MMDVYMFTRVFMQPPSQRASLTKMSTLASSSSSNIALSHRDVYGLVGMGAQDDYLDFHIAPELSTPAFAQSLFKSFCLSNFAKLRSCVKVQVAVLGSPSLIVLRASVDVKQHWNWTNFAWWLPPLSFIYRFVSAGFVTLIAENQRWQQLWTKDLRKIKLKVAFAFGLVGVQRHVSLCDDECLFVSVAVRAKNKLMLAFSLLLCM